MRVAIIHYHLRVGGVSRVIELACRALQESGIRVAVLAGGEPHLGLANLVPSSVLPELDYNFRASFGAGALRQKLEKTAHRLLGGTPDVWHIHNHSLGKNLVLPQVVASWAEDGRALLLQIHDFAENQRPTNYQRLKNTYGSSLNKILYPCGSHITYALLNSRDESLLQQAHFPGKIVRLPNPALPLPRKQKLSPQNWGAEQLIVYPCRALRRKNIGEALLLACAFPKDCHLVLASSPTSAEDLAAYKRWISLAQAQGLPVHFDVCSQQNIFLGDLISVAESLLTTSVEEGFGMVFLEAWLAHQPLIGRDLPSITKDFRASGLVLDSLYNFLGIPTSRLGKENIRRSLLLLLEKKFASLGMSIDIPLREKFLHQAFCGDRVDFGQLEPALQEEVIRNAARSSQAAQEIVPALPSRPSPQIIESNRQIVEKKYSLTSYRVQLTQIYENLASTAPSSVSFGDTQAILREFLMV